MPERRVVVEGMVLKYEGLFRFSELYDVIDNWLKEKGYDKSEKINQEFVLKTGKDIYIENWGTKALTDYARCTIKILIFAKKMKEVVVKRDNMDVKMNQGKVVVKLKGYLYTDWAGRWDGKPIFWFLRQVFDRWIYSTNTDRYEAAIGEEVSHLYSHCRGYLNLHRLK